LISSGGSHLLIDAGADANAVLNYIEENEIEKLEYLIITSFESCHTGGLRLLVASGIEIGNVIIPDAPQSSIPMGVRRILSSLESDCEVIKLGIGDADHKFNFGDGKFIVIAPCTTRTEDHLASYSIMVQINVSDKCILFMSDVTIENLTAMLQSSALPNADIITVASHGRYDVWTDDVLSAISPDIAIITPITSIDTSDAVNSITQKLESNNVNVINAKDDVVKLNVTDGVLTIK